MLRRLGRRMISAEVFNMDCVLNSGTVNENAVYIKAILDLIYPIIIFLIFNSLIQIRWYFFLILGLFDVFSKILLLLLQKIVLRNHKDRNRRLYK